MKKILMVLGVFVLSACGGSDDKGDPLAKLEGMWKGLDNYGVDGIDEYYFQFDSAGMGTLYDYMGDTYDNEGNCYEVFDFTVESKGGDKYLFKSFNGSGDPIEVQLKVNDSTMTMKSVDETTASSLTKSSRTESSMVPLCSSTALGKNKTKPYLTALPRITN